MTLGVMRTVNGFVCRNCADEEIAKRGIDPAHPTRAFAGSEAYVSTREAARNAPALGVNRPECSGNTGQKLNLYA
ncbi:MAG TPA: hypothetical protein VGI10_24170 [Polyangiaceae bacterium]|jgi:hypothetical protein